MPLKKISVFAALLLGAACGLCATLSENVQAVSEAEIAIRNAIQAKGGTPRGGLANAAEDIIAIPDKTVFDHTYVCFTNAPMIIQTNITQHSYALLESLHLNGNYMIVPYKATQNSCVEMKFTGMPIGSGEMCFFGDRSNSNAKFGLHRYQSQFSFPYYNNWNDYKGSIQSDVVLKLDAGTCYVDGVSKGTLSKSNFKTSGYLAIGAQNYGSTIYGSMNGYVHYVKLDKITSDVSQGTTNLFLVPAYDEDTMKACFIDIYNPNHPLICSDETEIAISYSSPTGRLVTLPVTNMVLISPEIPYAIETNIVGGADNKLIIDDAIRYLYQNMSDL